MHTSLSGWRPDGVRMASGWRSDGVRMASGWAMASGWRPDGGMASRCVRTAQIASVSVHIAALMLLKWAGRLVDAIRTHPDIVWTASCAHRARSARRKFEDNISTNVPTVRRVSINMSTSTVRTEPNQHLHTSLQSAP